MEEIKLNIWSYFIVELSLFNLYFKLQDDYLKMNLKDNINGNYLY